MGEISAIEWTEATWNPWHGCTKVSPGCDHCYMFRDKARFGQDPERVVRSRTKFFEPIKWKAPRVIFTCSWSDWFHKDADSWRDEAWSVIRNTPQHTYQILTKRPGRIARHLPADWGYGYRNVWLGVSVESQDYAYRVRQLAAVPAALRFVSAEPLLGPLNLRAEVSMDDFGKIAWLIAGGESGPDCRPMDIAWARALRDECSQVGIVYFLKQLGGWPNKRGGDEAVLDGQRHTSMPIPEAA